MRLFAILLIIVFSISGLNAQNTALDSLSIEILRLKQEGEIDSAILVGKEVYEISIEKKETIVQVETLHLLAALHLSKHELKLAEDYLDTAKKIIQPNLNNSRSSATFHGLKAFNLDRFGMLESFKKNSKESLAYRKKAAEYATKYVNNLMIIADCQNGLGNAYIDNNKPLKALSAFQNAILSRQKYIFENKDLIKEKRQAQKLLVALHQNNIGVCHELLEDFDEALEYYQKAYDTRKRLLPDNHPSIAESLYNLSFIYEHKGYYDKAFSYNKKSLHILKEKYGANHPEMIDVLNIMGQNKLDLGDIGQALVYFEEALNIHQYLFEDKMSNDIAEVHRNIGKVEILKEQAQKALYHLNKALSHWNDFPVKKSNTLVYIARAHQLNHDDTSAENAYNTAIRVLEKQKDHIHSFASALYDKAAFLLDKNRVNEAKALLEKAKNILESKDNIQANILAEVYLLLAKANENNPIIFQSYLEKAQSTCLVSSGEKELSELVFQKQYLRSFELEGDFYNNQEKNIETAIEKYKAALELSFNYRSKYESDGSKTLQAKESRRIIDKVIKSYGQIYEKDKTVIDNIYEIVEKAKSQALKENIRGLRNDRFNGIPKSLTQKENELQVELDYWKEELYYQLENNAPDSNITSIKSKIFEYNQDLEAMRLSLKESYPDYYRLKYVAQPYPISRVQSVLQKDETLIQYYLQDSFLAIVLVDRERKIFQMRPIEADWKKLPTKLLQAVEDKNDTLFQDISYRLYQSLLEGLPLNKKLIIIPDESLNILPFDLLSTQIVQKQKSYKHYPFLLKAHYSTKHYSADLFFEERRDEQATEKNLISIAPDYDSTAYEFLPFAAAEAETVASIMEGEAIIGKEATSRNFWSKIRNYNIVHLAAHAVIDDNNPLYSKLVFSPYKKKDSFIHTADLYRYNLQAQMVVLSACNTGAGQLQKGEGAISLARGFSYAGCPSILMSNWKAHDESSKDIMHAFYQNIKKGLSKSEALNQAKLNFLESANSLHSAPLYWGGFEIIGNNQALVSPSPFYLESHFILAMFLLLLPLFYLAYRKIKKA